MSNKKLKVLFLRVVVKLLIVMCLLGVFLLILMSKLEIFDFCVEFFFVLDCDVLWFNVMVLVVFEECCVV